MNKKILTTLAALFLCGGLTTAAQAQAPSDGAQPRRPQSTTNNVHNETACDFRLTEAQNIHGEWDNDAELRPRDVPSDTTMTFRHHKAFGFYGVEGKIRWKTEDCANEDDDDAVICLWYENRNVGGNDANTCDTDGRFETVVVVGGGDDNINDITYRQSGES